MDSYSILVAWLKVLLPLMALLLLSTLFLLSRNIDPTATIPFADTEIKDRLSGQQITGPFFSGATDSGDLVTVSAGKMSTRTGLKNEAEDFSARIDLTSGTWVTVRADRGQFDLASSQSDLAGNVVITTSSGYTLTSDALLANFDHLVLHSPGSVSGNGPIGVLDAGQMRLTGGSGDTNAQLLFTNGVKLIYDPKKKEE